MTAQCCSSTSTQSDSACSSPITRSFPASPTSINAATPPSNVDTSCKGDDKITLPSLCKQVAEPEAHPDFEAVMASLKLRSPLFTTYNTISDRPFQLSMKPMTVPSKHTANSPLHYYSSRNLAVPVPSNDRQAVTRKSSPFHISAPRPATVYAAAEYKVMAARYVTNADPRGFLPVYEYQLHGQTLMIDMETSYVQLASICSILGPSRANILRNLESSIELQPYIRKIERGFLKIQGLWAPLSVARELSRRVAWSIRFDLVPFFGFNFPTQCLSPNDPGFGDLRLLMGLRKSKKSMMTVERAPPQPLTQYSSGSESSSASPDPGNKLLHSYRPEQRRTSIWRDQAQVAQGALYPLIPTPQMTLPPAFPPSSMQTFTPSHPRKRMRVDNYA